MKLRKLNKGEIIEWGDVVVNQIAGEIGEPVECTNAYRKVNSKNEWRRVEDELPEYGAMIQAMTNIYFHPVSAYLTRDNNWYTFPCRIEITVTHWRELPKPPK